MTTADRTIHAIDSVLDAHTTAYHPGQLCPEDQHGQCAARPRPVPSPEDRMRDATAPTEEHAAARAFNDAHPIGTPVRYWKGAREGDGKVSRTRTPAQLLSGHTAVVWLENVSGCIALTHIQPISEDEFAATPAEQWPAAATGRSFAAYLTAQERDQLDARAATAEAERDDALADRDTARAEAANLRRELDKANAGRQKHHSELDTMTQVAQSNKRHVTYLTAVIEAIANVEPHIHNGDTTEDNCSPYCPGCRIRTAMNATPPSSVPPRRAQEDDLTNRLAAALAEVMRSHTGADVSVASWGRWEALLVEHAEREARL